MRNRQSRRGNGNVGCLIVPVAVLGLWFLLESATGIKSGWWGLLSLGLVVVVLFQLMSENEANKAKEKQAEKLRLEEERQRQWNSPEAVEKRRLEAERFRAEQEERERQKKVAEEAAARQKWYRYHRYMRIEEVDGMTGTEFENFIGTLFERLGHKDVMQTSASADQGADLVCLSPDNKRTAVQTKRWRGPVGNAAIQEVLAPSPLL